MRPAMSRRIFIGAVLATPAAAAFAQPRETWKTYVNDRFGTTIEYPSRFRPGRPPDNNDGQGFAAADGAVLAVWGSLNIEERDVAGLEAWLKESHEADEQITYRASGKNWLVQSGARGSQLFYRRYLLSHRNEIQNAFRVSYPTELKAAYDPIVARISRSLRAGRSYQVPGKP